MNHGAYRKLLPRRLKGDNKTAGGKCLIGAGSENMWGAAVLSALAAARVGAGYVYILNHRGNFPVVKNPDFLTLKNMKDFSIFSSIALGPGFKDHKLLKKLIIKLQKEKFQNVVLDAEALTVLSQMKKVPELPPSWILTPHEGEMSRLLGVSSSHVKDHRRSSIIAAQKRFGCLIVLKGPKTLIATSKRVFENPTGNSSLAKAGTGDVLTGIIAGLLSQKLSSENAARLGCYIHGSIADRWIANKKDQLSLLATDLIAELPTVLFSLRKPLRKP